MNTTATEGPRRLVAFDPARHGNPIYVDPPAERHKPHRRFPEFQMARDPLAGLASIISTGADGVLLSGCETLADFGAFDAALRVAEAEMGKPADSIRSLLLITSAKGLKRLGAMLDHTDRLLWIGLDTARFAGDIGVGADALPVVVAKADLVITARSYQLCAFEVPAMTSFSPSRAQQSAADGFAGILTTAPDKVLIST